MSRVIPGMICLLGLAVAAADSRAGVVSNFLTDLNDGSSSDPPGWTSSISGSASRSGTQLNSGGGSITYNRSVAADVAVSIEARVHADPGGGRLWLTLGDAFNDEHIRVDARLENNKFVLYDFYDDATPKAQIDLDWSIADPDVRVRLKRQEIDGTDYVVLQGEVSKTGPGASPLQWDDPLDRNPTPDTSMSAKVPLSSFSPQFVAFDEVGFGNAVAGAYNSFWTYVLVTEADDATTELPYWPRTPPIPTLVHDDKGVGNLQGIDLSADLGTGGYLTNDSAIAELDADGTTHAGDERIDPGEEVWDFDGLGDDQTVFGRVVVSEASGRSRMGPDGTTVIPDRTAPVPTLSRWGMSILLLLLLGSALIIAGRRPMNEA